jgi:hypothetical protein
MAEAPQSTPLDYQRPTHDRQLRIWALALALPAPTAMMTAYLTLTRWPTKHFTAWSDWAGLLASIGVGVVLVIASRLRRGGLLGTLVIFVPVQLGWLFFFSLDFVCRMFGDCL